jgi:transcriptional regulator with XRE-family HTH domain
VEVKDIAALGTDAVRRVSAMDPVTSKMQMQDAREPDRLRRLLSPYMQRHPVTRFRQRLAPLLTQVPPGPGRRFLDEAACAVAAGWDRRPKIEELADVSGCSRRQLERIVAESGLPSHRRLVDLLVLLGVRWAVAGDERFGEQEAWHLGLTHRDLLRLEGRMCGRDGGPALAALADELVRLVSLQNG